MDYLGFSTAGGAWVERQIAVISKKNLTTKDQRNVSLGKGWHAAPSKLNPFQHQVFGMLGVVSRGIHNAPIAWNTVTWRPDHIEVSWRGDLATYDFGELSDLVFLCCQCAIRMSVAPKGTYLNLVFTRRTPGKGWAKHPDLAKATEMCFRGLGSEYTFRNRRIAEVGTEAARWPADMRRYRPGE